MMRKRNIVHGLALTNAEKMNGMQIALVICVGNIKRMEGRINQGIQKIRGDSKWLYHMNRNIEISWYQPMML